MRLRRGLVLPVAIPCALVFLGSVAYGGDARADDGVADPQAGDEDEAPMIVVEPAPAGTTAPARAAPPPVVVGSKVERRWYGWQTLMLDGAAVDLVVLAGFAASRGNSSENERAGNTLALLSLGTYLLGPPIVHWAHGKVGVGFGSLGIRAGGPLVTGMSGLLIGAAIDGRGSSLAGAAVGAFIGLWVGHVIAVVVDAAALSFETVPVTPEPAAPKKAAMPSLRWTPMLGPLVSPTPESRGVHGGVAGVGGVF